MRSLIEVRRLLHANYNCTDVAVLERWYTELFGLQPVMRTDSADTPGVAFGLRMDTAHRTAFLYDHRGARRTTALELVQWVTPPTIGEAYEDPWDRGIQALAFAAPDLDGIAAQVATAGGTVVRRGRDWLLAKDPECVNVEVYRADAPPEQVHVRLTVDDLGRTTDWWSALGFEPAAAAIRVPAADIWPGNRERAVTDEIAVVATDDPTFALNFTTWSGPPPVGPSYGAPFHRGLYRLAMAVDDVHGAWEKLRADGLATQPPYTFQLPGTRITEGLTILFLRDPDGILVELVERPRSFFQ
ncbi:MAG: VOC family protein [Actinomycetota bacterium]|jgi:catechol 2,3-dioxygenase-like lactoylglutathione lyase family enzyme